MSFILWGDKSVTEYGRSSSLLGDKSVTGRLSYGMSFILLGDNFSVVYSKK